MDGQCKHGVWVEHNRERGGVDRECALCINNAGRALFDRMASMLRELEWRMFGGVCPVCDGAKPLEGHQFQFHTGHAPNCRLAALLKELT